MNNYLDISIFDLDDTLIQTTAGIIVYDKNGKHIRIIDTATYNAETDKSIFLEEGEYFDFSQFNELCYLDNEKVRPEFFVMVDRLRNDLPTAIVTSRERKDIIEEWIKNKTGIDVTDKQHFYIFCVSSSDSMFKEGTDAEKKRMSIEYLHKEYGYSLFYVYEDSEANKTEILKTENDEIYIKIMTLASESDIKNIILYED